MLALLAAVILIMPTVASVFLHRAGSAVIGSSLIRAHARYLMPWVVLEVGLTMIAAAIAVAWRDRLTVRLVRLGIAVGLLAGLGQGFRLGRTGDPFDLFWVIMQIVCVPIFFVAGGLLVDHTGAGRVLLLKGRPTAAVRGFLSGAALCLPFGLLNTLYGAHSGENWGRYWWDLAGYAWSPALAEETWARLFLIPFSIALLMPLTRNPPGRAVLASVMLSVLGHGLAHARTIGLFGPQSAYVFRWMSVTIFETGLLFLLPMAVLFIKRDWEHAVGFHYAVNLIPMLVAFW
jgi:hypothetical protein